MKPDFCTQEHLDYLLDLRDSGVTNMWNAPTYLEKDFILSKQESIDIFMYWIDTFEEN